MITNLIRNNRKTLFWTLIIILLASWGATVWYKNIYTDPRRVFSAMLDNSLRTTSVTKQIVQSDQSQSLDQVTRLQTGENHVVQGRTMLSQTGLASAKVVTESIGTPTSDFVRYKSIETDQKGSSGNALDFSQVLGMWGKTEADGKTTGELYGENTLGVIPVGNLSAENRQKLLSLASELDVYKVEYENVKHGVVNGRPAYEYKVKVSPESYVTLLKAYANLVGLTQLKDINPKNYANADSIEFTVTVDLRTRRLATVIYQGGRQENYLSFGSKIDVDTPKDSIAVQELQQRIQQVQ